MLRDQNLEHSSEAQNFKFEPEKSDSVLDQLEDVRDEHVEPNQKTVENINFQEAEGVNNVVSKFNNEFAKANLKDADTRQEWEDLVEGIKTLNKEVYEKYRMQLDIKLGELS